MYTQLNVKRVLFQTIQFNVCTVSMSKTDLFQPIQFSISTQFTCKTVLFQAIQFSISTHFSSIWPYQVRVDLGNEGVLCISQSSSIAGTSPSDCLVSYSGNSLGWGAYPQQRSSRCIQKLQPTGQFKTLISVSFPLVEAPLKLLFRNGGKLLPFISFWKSFRFSI